MDAARHDASDDLRRPGRTGRARRARRRRSSAAPAAVVALAVALCALAGCAGDDGEPTVAPATTAPTRGEVAAPATPTGATEPGEVTTDDGRTRTWTTYVPASLPDGPVPLVLVLHGGLGNGAQVRESSGYDGLAEANGFLVAYPDGIGGVAGQDDRRTWNAGACCGPAEREQVDDVAFLRTVIATIADDHDVDPALVLVVGHSNGGMMAYRMACEASDVVTGVGSVGSSLEVEPCDPAEPVTVAAVHGLDDRQHPYEGGSGDRSISRVDYRPARDGVELLATSAGCGDAPQVARDGDLEITTWSGCDDGTAVQLATIEGASHAWPGARGDLTPAQRLLVGEPYRAYDASAELYGFLVAHPRG